MTREIFNNLLNSIGNNFPSPPTLEFSNYEKSVASISNGNIVIERKALNILCSFPDSESAIAYILSHELGHHYLNHSWMNNSGLSYASSLGNYLSEKSNGYEQRKIEETQADLFGGFFSQISGYQSLTIASDVLEEIYSQYNLPHTLNGYPTFDERVTIIEANLIKIKKLNLIFEVGKLSILRGDYDIAIESFRHILNKKFTSREIYNNLGCLYLKNAIDNLDEDISKYIYPIFFEENTRAETGITRDLNNILSDPIKELESAIDMFKRSISLDNSFIPAKTNLLLCQIIKCKVEENDCSKSIINELNSIPNIDEDHSYDIQVLYSLILSDDKKSLIKKKSRKGSIISEYNFNISYGVEETRVSKTPIIEKYKNFNVDDLLLNGLVKPYGFVSSGRGLKIRKKEIGKDFIYEVNNSIYYIEINDEKYSSYDGIKIGTPTALLLDLKGASDEVIKFGEILFFNYKESRIAFAIQKGKIVKIIIYS